MNRVSKDVFDLEQNLYPDLEENVDVSGGVSEDGGVDGKSFE